MSNEPEYDHEADHKTAMVSALERLYADSQLMQILMTKKEAFMLVVAIQLACRHPEFKGETRETVEGMARKIGAELTANDNDLRLLLEMGWQEQFDEVRHE